MTVLYLAIFGLIGIFSRYGLNVLAANVLSGGVSVATIFINIVGSFLIGIIYVVASERQMMSEELRIGLMTGLLGGFTTFSTFSLEAMSMIADRQYLSGTLYILASVCGGLAAAAVGLYAGRFAVGAGWFEIFS